MHPEQVTAAGYRLYGEKTLARLQQILLFRELEFSLSEIKALLEEENFDAQGALQKQKELLVLKRDRLTGLIALTSRLLKGEKEMSFQEFDLTAIEEEKKKYAEEVRERWGNTPAYEEWNKKVQGYNKKDWDEMQKAMNLIFQKFANCMEKGPQSLEAEGAVREWQQFISQNFYTCTNDILWGLGEMYTEDSRFMDTFEKIAPGLADFIARAIQASLKSQRYE